MVRFAAGAAPSVWCMLQRPQAWWRSFAGSISPYIRVVRLLPRVSRPLTIAVGFGIIVGAALPVAFAVAIGALVGTVPNTVRDGLASPSGVHALRVFAVVSAIFVTLCVVAPVRVALAAALGRRLDLALQQRVLHAVGRPMGIAHLEDPVMLDQLARARGVTAGAEWPAGATVVPLANVATQWLQGLGAAVVLGTFHWWLAVLLFVAWAATSHVFRREFLRLVRVLSLQVTALRRADYLRDLALTPAAAKEIRLWGMVDWLIAAGEAAWLRVMTPIWRERTVSLRISATAIAGMALMQWLAFATAGVAAVQGHIDLASLAILIATINGMDVLAGLNSEALHLAYGVSAVPAALELERRLASTTNEHNSNSREQTLPLLNNLPRSGIQFEGVTVRYPGSQVDVLSGLNLFVPAGRSLAIVGANGAGKTTLVKTLARLYEPSAGRILVDELDLCQLDPQVWRTYLAAVFQDFVQYPLSARENLTLGAIEYARLLDPATLHHQLKDAARKAGILEAIEALPRAWETVLSREFQEGADLSGGQWQRLALARALFAVRAGARVLILDEPTAHLDVRAEAALYERFLDLTQGLTTILISHRFSTVRRADQICVLEHGRVAELGSHDDLLAAGGRYATMFELQARRFAENDGRDEHRKGGEGCQMGEVIDVA